MGVVQRRIESQHGTVYVWIPKVSFLLLYPNCVAPQPGAVGPQSQWRLYIVGRCFQFQVPRFGKSVVMPFLAVLLFIWWQHSDIDDSGLLEKCCFVGEQSEVEGYFETSRNVVREFPCPHIFGGSLDQKRMAL
jgi:hypothetical protein